MGKIAKGRKSCNYKVNINGKYNEKLFCSCLHQLSTLILLRMAQGVGKKALHTRFSPVISANIDLNPQNLLAPSFSSLAILL